MVGKITEGISKTGNGRYWRKPKMNCEVKNDKLKGNVVMKAHFRLNGFAVSDGSPTGMFTSAGSPTLPVDHKGGDGGFS